MPAGRAAQKLQEVCGEQTVEAKTVHRLLQYKAAADTDDKKDKKARQLRGAALSKLRGCSLMPKVPMLFMCKTLYRQWALVRTLLPNVQPSLPEICCKRPPLRINGGLFPYRF